MGYGVESPSFHLIAIVAGAFESNGFQLAGLIFDSKYLETFQFDVDSIQYTVRCLQNSVSSGVKFWPSLSWLTVERGVHQGVRSIG